MSNGVRTRTCGCVVRIGRRLNPFDRCCTFSEPRTHQRTSYPILALLAQGQRSEAVWVWPSLSPCGSPPGSAVCVSISLCEDEPSEKENQKRSRQAIIHHPDAVEVRYLGTPSVAPPLLSARPCVLCIRIGMHNGSGGSSGSGGLSTAMVAQTQSMQMQMHSAGAPTKPIVDASVGQQHYRASMVCAMRRRNAGCGDAGVC